MTELSPVQVKWFITNGKWTKQGPKPQTQRLNPQPRTLKLNPKP